MAEETAFLFVVVRLCCKNCSHVEKAQTKPPRVPTALRALSLLMLLAKCLTINRLLLFYIRKAPIKKKKPIIMR